MCFDEEDEDSLVGSAWPERAGVFGLATCETSDFLQGKSLEIFYGSAGEFCERGEGAAL